MPSAFAAAARADSLSVFFFLLIYTPPGNRDCIPKCLFMFNDLNAPDALTGAFEVASRGVAFKRPSAGAHGIAAAFRAFGIFLHQLAGFD